MSGSSWLLLGRSAPSCKRMDPSSFIIPWTPEPTRSFPLAMVAAGKALHLIQPISQRASRIKPSRPLSLFLIPKSHGECDTAIRGIGEAGSLPVQQSCLGVGAVLPKIRLPLGDVLQP